MMTGILLILRRVHTGVICNSNDYASVYSCVRYGVQKVGRYVQTNMFHSAKRTSTCNGCAGSNFGCDFFIGSPFTIHFFKFCGCLIGEVAERSKAGGALPLCLDCPLDTPAKTVYNSNNSKMYKGVTVL